MDEEAADGAEAEGGRGGVTVGEQQRPQKARWSSSLCLVRQESQGLIGRYRCDLQQ